MEHGALGFPVLEKRACEWRLRSQASSIIPVRSLATDSLIKSSPIVMIESELGGPDWDSGGCEIFSSSIASPGDGRAGFWSGAGGVRFSRTILISGWPWANGNSSWSSYFCSAGSGVSIKSL